MMIFCNLFGPGPIQIFLVLDGGLSTRGSRQGSLPRRRGLCPAGPVVRVQAPPSSRTAGCGSRWRLRLCGRSGSPGARRRG